MKKLELDLGLGADPRLCLAVYLVVGPAVALHEGSTLLVVLNALRLLIWRERA